MTMTITKMKSYRHCFNRGFGLMEILVASAIISASLFALAGTAQLAFRVIAENSNRVQAEFLAEEGLEVVRILRDSSWSSNIPPLSSGISYYPVFSSTSSTWMLASKDPGLIEGLFSRVAIFDDVYRRDSDDDIVASTSPDSNTLDEGTKQVTSRVSWQDDEKYVEFTTYITDMFSN